MKTETRRSFVKKAILASSSAGLGVLNTSAQGNTPISENTPEEDIKKEWRNKQDGMEYRQLGRTGLMVSAMVIGGGRINPNKYKYLAQAFERGVNYIDTASRYGKGNSELGVGKVIKWAGREKLFISTKTSSYLPFIE